MGLKEVRQCRSRISLPGKASFCSYKIWSLKLRELSSVLSKSSISSWYELSYIMKISKIEYSNKNVYQQNEKKMWNYNTSYGGI